MASYQELHSISTDPAMLVRVEIAIVVAAHTLLNGSPTTADRRWAKVVLYDPSGEAKKAWRYILADNKDLSLATITGVPDSQLQTKVLMIAPALVAAMSNA